MGHGSIHRLAARAATGVAGAAVLVGWRGARERVARADRAAADARRDAERARAEVEPLERRLRQVESTLDRERRMLARVQQSWKAEREWSRELRGQIARLYERPDTAPQDVHGHILQAAIQLVEAEKGLLLSREDADGDGDLDVVVAHGFDNDPQRSAVAQRFAREVLERDAVLRVDGPVVSDDVATPADREIDTLVAIPLYLRSRFSGVVVCANRPGGFAEVGDDVFMALGDQAGAALHQGQLRTELREAHRVAIRVLVETLAAGDPAGHRETSRLVVYAAALARELELDEGERDVLICATLLRAVGYLALPDRLRLKPGPLTPEEHAVVQLHPRIGFNVVSQAPALREVAAAVLYHHERFDGEGYPAGLAGTEIPRAARALAVLEAYGAMTHDRPYRPRRSRVDACEEIVAAAGTQFDPEIAQLFVEEVRQAGTPPGDDLAEAILEALPLQAADDTGGVLGPLVFPSTDGLTLLGNHRALQSGVREAARTAGDESRFAVVLVQLEDLSAINDEAGPLAGDRVIQGAARCAQRAAARLGGSAYRASGRRLAVLAPVRNGDHAEHLLEQVRIEFAAGPVVRTALSVWEPGLPAEEVVGRARRTLGESDVGEADRRPG